MKKALVIVLIAALSLMLAAVLAGCGGGGQTEEAKAFMEAGDEAYALGMMEYDSMLEVQGEIANAAMSGDTSAFTGEAGQLMAEEFMTVMDSFDISMGTAKVSYEEIYGLDGADDYKSYADLMIKACDVRSSQLDPLMTLVEDFMAMAAQSEATGEPLDLNVLMESEELAELTELDEEASDYEKQAEDLKQEKGLV
jgi:hypothetical protein